MENIKTKTMVAMDNLAELYEAAFAYVPEYVREEIAKNYDIIFNVLIEQHNKTKTKAGNKMEKIKNVNDSNFIEQYRAVRWASDGYASLGRAKKELLKLYDVCGLACKVDHITTELDLLRAVHALEMYMKTTGKQRDKMNQIRNEVNEWLDSGKAHEYK